MVGPRVFELPEVDELLPELVRIFAELDGYKKQLRTLTIRANALEMIWGDKVHGDENPDHAEFDHHVAEMKRVKELFEAAAARVTELGGQIKSVDPPLVDFLGVRDGRLVYWCWTRGETAVTHWHHLDEGFEARQPV